MALYADTTEAGTAAFECRRPPEPDGRPETMKIAAPLGVALVFALASPCLAGPQDVTPALRQAALDNCTGDAMRLCPQALTDEGQAVSCMASKRSQLSTSCRVVYDRVARVLKD